ncbi:MAG: multidrug effflux MFS transporter [Lautropia sp.]|nr:multidrug effflux MFS transporter [Lautropia sp.]
MSAPTPPAPRNLPVLLATLGALLAVTSLSTDIYLPAMPHMAADLRGDVELTITGYFLGFAIGQIFWGPISDRIGRKLPLYIGMALFAIGSVGCALADNITTMVLWRVFQALGGCVGPMLARAMIRDLYSPQEGARMMSTLTAIMAVAPIIGPLIGGYIVHLGHWTGIFWLLAVIGGTLFLAVIRLDESLPPSRRRVEPLAQSFTGYITLLGNRAYMRPVLCVTLFYVAVFAFLAGSPAVYIEHFGVGPQHYGWLFAMNILGVMAVSFVNRQLVRKYDLDTLLRRATLIATLTAFITALCATLDIGGLPLIATGMLTFFSTNGVISACANVKALEGVPHMAGTGAALLGAMQYGSGVLPSIALAGFDTITPAIMCWLMALATLGSMLFAFSRPASPLRDANPSTPP